MISDGADVGACEENERRALVPKRRFLEFRGAEAWARTKVGEVAQILKGRGISKADITALGLQPCIRYGELYTRYGDVISEVFSRTSVHSSDLFLSRKNDVIMPSSGETRNDIATASCVLLDNVALGGDLNVIRSRCNGVFLSYFLNGRLKGDIAKVAQGDAVVHLYPGQIASVTLAIPQRREQQKIADCLLSLDKVIAAEGERLAALREHKKALLRALFPAEGQTTPRLRFPEFRGEGKWISSELGRVVTTVTPAKKLQSKDYQATGRFPIVDQGQSRIAGWTNDETSLVSKALPVVVFGDHTCVLKFVDFDFAQGADGIKILKPTGELSVEFLFYALQANPLRSDKYKRHFSELIARSITFPDISTGEQQKIAACLSTLDSAVAALTSEVDALKMHKSGLMQQLFPSPLQVTT